jgi:hypothetical protein
MIKKISFTIILFFSIFNFCNFVFAETTAGFIPGQIWYSKDSLEEGDNVKIYTAIWNGSENSIFTKVTFYDKEVVLGNREITIPSMSTKDVSISWQVTAGDHNIHAKIISSTVSKSGKEENVVLARSSTKEDHQYVSVKLKTADGKDATSGDIVNSQITNVIDKIVPDFIGENVSNGIGVVDFFRSEKSKEIEDNKGIVEKKIEVLKNSSENFNKSKNLKIDSFDTIKKPIAYIELFFLKVLSFIFGNKWVFYGIILILVFLILRFIYRKIRRR